MTTSTIVSILVAVISFSIGFWTGFKNLFDAKFSDEITFVKGGKQITISSKLGDADIKKLAHL
jgi:hypothetical protein